MLVEPVKAQAFPGWVLEVIAQDDKEREILLSFADSFWSRKQKLWVSSIDYTDGNIKSITFRMVKRSKFKKTVRDELTRLTRLSESVGERLGELFARVKALDERADALEAWGKTELKGWFSPTEHKCSMMPSGASVSRKSTLPGLATSLWRLHTDRLGILAPRIDYCPYCGVKLP